MLALQNVTKRFGALIAVNDVSFTVNEGELVALIGPNGAGKSTLLDMMAGEQAPTSGSVTFDNRTISGRPAYEVNRAGLVRTFQQLNLFGSLTVRDNVIAGGAVDAQAGVLEGLLGLPSAKRKLHDLRERADEYLEMVALSHRAETQANALPAGERRLIAIARALATGRQWLLLDEPGAGLNAVEKDSLLKVIRKLARSGKTIIFVEHDMSLVGRLAERVVVLNQGRLIADDAPEKIRSDPAVLEAYLGVQTVGAARPAKPSRQASAKSILKVEGMSVDYGGLHALSNVSFDIAAGEIVTILGPNGAGKSTLLKAIAGVVHKQSGKIEFDGKSLDRMTPSEIVRTGISLVPEGRELFGSLTVEDNLSLGRYSRGRGLERLNYHSSKSVKDVMAEVFTLFPRLGERRHQLAETLSGGEGQMLAIGRALMSSPKLLMLDEPSLGLAPKVIEEIFGRLFALQQRGLSILLIEQNARAALEIADRGYVLELGSIVASGASADLLANADIVSAYLGTSSHASMSVSEREVQLQSLS